MQPGVSAADQHDVGIDHLIGTVHTHGVRAAEVAGAADHTDALCAQTFCDVLALLRSQVPDASIEFRHIDADTGVRRVLGIELQPEPGTFDGTRQDLRRCDEGLARDHIGEHRCTTEAIAVDDRHAGAQLRTHKGGFVSAGPTADDHHTRHGRNPVVLPSLPRIA
mgnify:FL=1